MQEGLAILIERLRARRIEPAFGADYLNGLRKNAIRQEGQILHEHL
jgi:hypothetical protein